ncbi:MAG TPA: ribosome-binding factor A [Candidatus Paceibacterota bacterium]|nr:ribosome-binding factor A [Candidatus Paceibacterota bacterium]
MLNRIAKVNQLIKKELSQIILREIDFSPGILVTLTRVETVPNLSESRIYLSVIPEARQEKAFIMLRNKVWHLQQLLNKRLRMRPIPKICFIEEKETLEAGKIEEILVGLKKDKK